MLDYEIPYTRDEDFIDSLLKKGKTMRRAIQTYVYV